MKKLSIGVFLTSVVISPYTLAAAGINEIQPVTVAQSATAPQVTGAVMINPTTVELIMSNGHRMTVDFYSDNIFRLFRDDEGGIVRDPVAEPPAEILVRNPRRSVGEITVSDHGDVIDITTPAVSVECEKATGLLTVTDLRDGRTVIRQTVPVSFERGKTSLALAEAPDEYFYGGGVQNGRFSHKGRRIAIENQNSWTDGGVASPAPFYWSTGGYGIMFHTFGKGKYDFGAEEPGTVTLCHESPYLDIFVMVDEKPEALLSDFYQLTGSPVLIPKFGFYEGHLNAYNRDYWTEDEKGILFEDGKRYKESQRDNGGVKESLNGENNNYQFSARAVVDRYAANDMPLGWILPNDGYGAGYGQAETLDGNIQNLKSFGDYARSKGVEIGLWTQSDLHPKPEISALLQRDIVKEVRDAGVRVLKTDVAWVGWGYSFGLNGVADVGEIMPYYGNDARPFIISLDGWAGTQRYATIWSGDQTGGEWEYIRFHIPTYIGSGLSGQPNITSDMDGIFGGLNPAVNIRDFQWKTFTPMQLNMDGWGRNEKYPHALGEPAASINRTYLKMKSELLPYAYTYAREAVEGKPLIRAMFIDYPSTYTYGPATRYQYLYGPSFLVAPIYQDTKADSVGNDIRNGIYLPEGRWIDYITGEAYDGGVVLNGFDAPIWKLPVFVKGGSIIPMVNPNNNPSEIDRSRRIFEFFPEGKSELTVYDDDGVSMRYASATPDAVTTHVSADMLSKGRYEIRIDSSQGKYDGYDPMQSTELIINVTQRPQSVIATIGGRKIRLTEVESALASQAGSNTYYYEESPERNLYATPGSEFASVSIPRTPQLIVNLEKTDVSVNPITVSVKGLVYAPGNNLLSKHGALSAPVAVIDSASIGAYEIMPSWQPVDNADYYEIEFNGMNYTNIRDTELLFDGLSVETPYVFKLRAVNADGVSDWVSLSATTRRNPLEWAIRGIRGEVTSEIQSGFGIGRLFDFTESGDIFHTRYRKNGITCEIIADLQSVNTLDHMDYLPRLDGGNGTWLKGNVSVSLDKIHWTEVDSFAWERNGEVKQFVFTDQPQARYVRINVTDGVNNYATGRELYIFKVPGSESYIPGDINNDGKVDENDLMSYTNYTGLRTVDSDFDYVSIGDINRNGLIDSYDISVAATRLDGGDEEDEDAVIRTIGGDVTVDLPKGVTAAGDIVSVIVRGDSLQGVNAVSMAIEYDPKKWEFVGVEQDATAGMDNLTNDRLHTNGVKAVYPTFVNIGNKPVIEGDKVLFTVKFKALVRGTFDGKISDLMIVDRLLNIIEF